MKDLLFLSSVFFHCSITQWEEFSLGVREGHTQTPHAHMCSLMQMLAKVRALTHSHSPSVITLFCLGCVSFLVLFSFSAELLISFVSALHTFFFFYKRSGHMCFSNIFHDFIKSSKPIFLIKTNPYPPALWYFASEPPPRSSPTISFRSSASSLSFPGSHAGDSRAAHRDGEGSKGEHEHLCTQRGSLGAGGERPHWGSKTGWRAPILDLILHQNTHARARMQAARPRVNYKNTDLHLLVVGSVTAGSH